jgi:Fe-S-cluster containining protein
MIVALSRPYTARNGAPTVERVDQRIFELTYFNYCMSCTFCHDSCCQYGATVEEPKVRAILNRADELESYVGIPRQEWFLDHIWWQDPDYPGDRYTRTRVRSTDLGNRCVFSNTKGRGCLLHKFALERGTLVHEIKPLACNLFPVMFDGGVLIVPVEIADRTLVCIDQGPTLYRSARNDLQFYFGPDLVVELDDVERVYLSRKERPGAVSLALVSAACG